MRRRFFGLLVSGGLAVSSVAGEAPADLVLKNGRIVTLSEAAPEVQAIAITGYSISALGSDAEIAAHVGEGTRVIDLAGRLAIPGFIEGHGHFSSLGESKMILDLTRVANWDEIVTMVREAAAKGVSGAWILGRGWHQEKWTSAPGPNVDGVPLNDGLSAASPENPVLLEHASGHAAFANDRALELAGITKQTLDPEGGTIVRDAAGEATGLLRETAQGLVGQALSRDRASMTADEREAEFRKQVELAGREALSKGVTSFHDAGSPFDEIDAFKALAANGGLPIRLYVMVRGESNEEMDRRLPDYRVIPAGNDYLAVRSIKRQIDGALGSHGAWLLEPYTDLPSTTGLVLEPVDDIDGTARVAVAHGFQVNTHAIGDRANREVLDIYEKTFAAHPKQRDLRWRIEHAQHVHPDDLPRFAKLGVIASMQGVHCTSDGPWVPKRIGDDRARSGAYMWRTLLDSGAVVTNGTDVPVEDIDPIASFYSTVSRRSGDGSVFYPAQAMTREEALRSYTLANAYAAFEEHVKGSLEVGKLADIVVLSKDILKVPEQQIPEARVDVTIVGGEVRYER